MTTFYSLIRSHSPIRGDPGQQGWLLGSRRLVLERRILQSTPAHLASVCGGKRQHETGSRCQEPVCQRNVCPVIKPFTWMSVQTGHEEGKELPEHLLEPPSVYHTWLDFKDKTFLTFKNTIIIFQLSDLNECFLLVCYSFRTKASGELSLWDSAQGLRLCPLGLHHSWQVYWPSLTFFYFLAFQPLKTFCSRWKYDFNRFTLEMHPTQTERAFCSDRYKTVGIHS